MGAALAHKPFFASRASISSVSSSVFPGAYFLYHQHQPSFTSSWLTLVPSGKSTIGNGAPVLVKTVSLKRDLFPEDECRSGLLR